MGGLWGGEIWGSRWRGAFSAIRRGFSGRFEAPPDKPVPFHPRFATFPATGGMLPRSNQGPDASDRRSGGIERKNPLYIRQALSLAGSGQAGHEPSERQGSLLS